MSYTDCTEEMALRASHLRYHLPDGRIVSIAWELCKGRPVIDFTLANGRITQAVICQGER